jgi:catechol 2,3-dioxygenase-like lactoylglutathione lyase family enzyme
MLTGLRWLALEVKYLDRAASFYRQYLGMDEVRSTGDEVAFAAGETDLVLRAPSGVPRGGLHTHYALSTPYEAYDDWWDRLSERFDLVEHQFGDARSLYFYDTEGNCVEIGQRGGDGDGITGIFEVVLEVEDLPRAESFYTALGMEPVSRGQNRRRVRLSAGPFDFELWEPHLGLADARGGVHVDLGLATDDPQAAADAVAGDALAVQSLDDGVRVRDPDGHYLTFR